MMMYFNELSRLNDEREAADIRAGRIVVDRARGLELILSVIERINQSLVLEEVLPLVVDNAVKFVGGDRGAASCS